MLRRCVVGAAHVQALTSTRSISRLGYVLPIVYLALGGREVRMSKSRRESVNPSLGEYTVTTDRVISQQLSQLIYNRP